MKVLHINTNVSGGASNACIRLHKALLEAGIDSNILFLGAVQDIPNAHSFASFEQQKYGKWFVWLKDILNRVLNRLPSIFKPAAFFNTPYSLYRIEKHPLFQQADIVHLHWVVKFADYPGLFANKQKPFVWTMHDMAPFSGGYHYLVDFPLESYKNLVQRYEQVKTSALNQNKLHVVALSRWLMNVSAESRVFGSFPHYNIPNCIDTAVFAPGDKQAVRQRLSLPQDKKIVLFVAENTDDRRKGFIYLKQALELLPEDTVLLVMGKNTELTDSLPVHNLGYLSSAEQIRDAYVAADIFVIPSVEDNLPNTVMEALACGIPSVGFATGGIPDMIEHLKTGYLVNDISAEALAEGISFMLAQTSSADFSNNCRKKALAEYSEAIITEKIIGLYNQIIT